MYSKLSIPKPLIIFITCVYYILHCRCRFAHALVPQFVEVDALLVEQVPDLLGDLLLLLGPEAAGLRRLVLDDLDPAVEQVLLADGGEGVPEGEDVAPLLVLLGALVELGVDAQPAVLLVEDQDDGLEGLDGGHLAVDHGVGVDHGGPVQVPLLAHEQVARLLGDEQGGGGGADARHQQARLAGIVHHVALGLVPLAAAAHDDLAVAEADAPPPGHGVAVLLGEAEVEGPGPDEDDQDEVQHEAQGAHGDLGGDVGPLHLGHDHGGLVGVAQDGGQDLQVVRQDVVGAVGEQQGQRQVHEHGHREDLALEVGGLVVDVGDVHVPLVEGVDERLQDLRRPLEGRGRAVVLLTLGRT